MSTRRGPRPHPNGCGGGGRTIHRVEPLDDGGARVLYRTEIEGPTELAEQIGPAITGDFPDMVAALISQC